MNNPIVWWELATHDQENGGFIVDPPAELAPGEWLCLFNDPSGVTFAMIQDGRE